MNYLRFCRAHDLRKVGYDWYEKYLHVRDCLVSLVNNAYVTGHKHSYWRKIEAVQIS